MPEFTHFNKQGRAQMVDITEKKESHRLAVAKTSVLVNEHIYQQIHDQSIKKGDVLAVAQVAGIMAAKQTAALIPMCHPIPISGVDIAFDWVSEASDYRLVITVSVKTKGSTGVEMEALTAASACALTVYDMCKAVDKGMVIGPTYLVEKSGGKNGDFRRSDPIR
ncbi:cyclic pyranopterin monophosphate synthase MoaC [Bacillus badius]|uniref:Cyclic pyranopterin monophosphate synthase n=1 Tax=Bacillus badius TaxID=1455 RepID=A0ABR5AWB0_BACBA|nr:cyclic pyranopterin monophosphate synthase MoaC [Bacillus badius]KIL74545.1 Molybdenum cofactor biosynthesis protein MoaC [Bacillus badius]KIL79013.1 Molybdenum cofactor biosynthesis protein MoaC [Bacillus badius]KZR58809.1 cyclic pyranopterin monophosphate synthase accessory protein [Bacillus badius]MED4715551.1 cyclic pyranopterin monophosphate synthase MoaC [Bacillus badius]